jgi:hypothetical protein
MRWSQLKQRVQANFAPRVRGRIELFQTRYRRAADSFGEVWVAVDGKRRYSWGDITFIQAEAAAYRADRVRLKDENPSREEYFAANRRVLGDLEARGVAMRWKIERLLLESLSLSVERLLKHRSPIVRGIAVLDRRCGKRRLAAIDAGAEHPFVRGMLEFRRAAEGITSLPMPPAQRG